MSMAEPVWMCHICGNTHLTMTEAEHEAGRCADEYQEWNRMQFRIAQRQHPELFEGLEPS